MLTVHHLNNSRSQRVLWLLEELGADYEIVRYERDPNTMRAPEALREVHPLGKSPVVSDDGLTVAETGAVVEYILQAHGGGRFTGPADPAGHWRYRHWMHYAEGSAMPPLLIKLLFGKMESDAPGFLKPFLKPVLAKVNERFLGPELKAHADYWEAAVKETGWFAGGEISAADIMMSFPVETAAARIGYQDRPALKDFLERIHSRPAYGRALERGGPYVYA